MLQGVLGVVLHLSRISGVFPLSPKGPKLSVSFRLVVCAKIFAVVVVIVNCLFTANTLLFHEFKRPTLIFELLRIFANIITAVALLIAVFTSPQRTIRFTRILQELDEMDKEVLENNSKNKSEIKLTIFVLSFLLISFVVRAYSFIYFINNEKSSQLRVAIYLFILWLALLMLSLTEVQVSLLARRINLSLKEVNNTLEHLYTRKSSNDYNRSRPQQMIFVTTKRVNEIQSTTEKLKQDNSGGKLIKVLDKNPVKLIRQCIKNYLSICDIITNITQSDGILLGILIFCHILYLMSNSYKIISYSSSPIDEEANIYIAFYSSLLHAMIMTFCVEPYHGTETEMQRLQFLLRSMKWKNIDKTEIRNELNLFWSIMCMNKATYSPLGMFTLDRMFVLKVFGSLVTYMVIVFTYGS
ncbi:putative gustatory receptor 28b [Danaus plexippus]|uniref:putative gustatory receptor 28b n=1 Tax=Danaus plexippus TaxID=13037 RepID=UPI002AAF43FF|nr:putative gustatory receptor 28b [Danaus plexippus]